MRNRPLDVNRIPMHNRADDEVEARCAEGLAFKRPIADFTTLVEEDRTLELVSSFAFVQAGLATSTQRRAGIPLDHEEGPLDATEFAKGSRKPALLRRCGELLQNSRRHDGSCGDRRREVKKIVPVVDDLHRVDRRSDMIGERRISVNLLERVEPPVFEIAQPRRESSR